MDLLKQMADAFVILIRTGAVFRVVYCLVRMGMNEEEAAMYKKRARNTVVFYVIAESIWQIKELVLSYFV
ncbi:MAG TPA: mercury transporter [Clostridiaceae bacterium]|nr:mercury transporter [Clostridiaceae bacterium]